MIRTLVVDDDYMTASIHRAYTERVGGFAVVGEAHTGAEALELAHRLRPDLILLDIYLPDLSGLEVIRRLRHEAQEVDVLAVTAAKDVETLRAAMQGGVVHYIVKPFLFDTFRERLERYAALKGRLVRIREASQDEVDRLFALLRVEARSGLPKGIAAPTLGLVVDSLRAAAVEVSAAEVADQAGLSRGTARRYLEYLVSLGSVGLNLRYGAAGRPEHLYRWLAGSAPAAGDAYAGRGRGSRP